MPCPPVPITAWRMRSPGESPALLEIIGKDAATAAAAPAVFTNCLLVQFFTEVAGSFCELVSGEQFRDGLTQAVAGYIERTLFNLVAELRRDSHCLEDRSMKILNNDTLFQRLAWPFGSRFAVEITALCSAAEHEDRAGVCEMPVHSVIFQ